MGKSNRNISIQMIRIVAMFMIVTDHMLHHCSFPMKSTVIQITNSGVFIFLFISGYLFGLKEINNWGKWFLKRITRVLIPFWIFVLIDFVVEQIIWHNVSIEDSVIYLFNVQGIFGTRATTNPLWFLTLLMICYLITPLLSKIKRIQLSKRIIILIVSIYLIIQLLCAFFINAGMVFGHTVGWCLLAVGVYGLAFFAGDRLLKTSIKRTLVVTVIAICFVGVVLLIRHFYDGTKLYEIVSWYGIVLVDYWIICILSIIAKVKSTVKLKGIIDFFDKISYEFYLVHSVIISLIVIHLSDRINAILFIVLTLALSIISALLLNLLTKPIIRLINKRIEK